MDNKKKNSILLTSAAIFIAAQFDFYLFGLDFKISLAVVIIATIAFVTEYHNLVTCSAIAILACVAVRVTKGLVAGHSFANCLKASWPEAAFYIVFCLCLIVYKELSGGLLERRYFVPVVMLSDFICNEIELMIRTGGNVGKGEYLVALSIIALVRGFLLWGILTFMRNFRLSVQRKSEIERYNRAMIMISKLRGETIWMEKNMSLIENTMNTSFSLYSELRDGGDTDQAGKALKVANDIHEVKKEYYLIMKGLREAVAGERQYDGMMMSDIVDLIRDSADNGEVDIKSFKVDVKNDFYTEQHYEYLTIFNNLVTNAIEAKADDSELNIEITVRKDGDNNIIRVYNSGPEIPEDFREKIFNAGFSTKIDYETGQISRGLGLCHVKDIVENMFGGSIILEDIEGGNAFVISVPDAGKEVA